MAAQPHTDERPSLVKARAVAAELRRRQTHCKRGHSLEDAYVRPGGVRRECRTCKEEHRARQEALGRAQMLADKHDERHGTVYGYMLGCRCNRCGWAYSLYREARKATA